MDHRLSICKPIASVNHTHRINKYFLVYYNISDTEVEDYNEPSISMNMSIDMNRSDDNNLNRL